MTNYYENLDIILSQYRLEYQAYKKAGDFIGAAKSLFDRNSAHPPEAFLSDMPEFVLRTNDPLWIALNANDKARQYCEYWNPRLERAMAEFRLTNQEQYNKL